MLSLERKVAIITGGTSGIGARTAALFVEEGARVVIAGRRRERGEQFARALGECARFVPTDVAVESDVKAMIGQAMTWFGRIDCLVNNAGAGSQWVGIDEVDLDQFDAAIAVHVRGALAAMKHAVPIMAAQGSGSIITVASVNGVRAGLGGLYYSVAKAAGLDDDEADVNPEYAEAAIAAVLPRWQPLPHVGHPDDIAQAALFLASDAARLMTGHNLVVDGGICAGWPAGAVRDDITQFRKTFQEKQAANPA